MFSRLFKRKPTTEPCFVSVQLNAKLQPVHRAEYFEEPLEKVLRRNRVGEVDGGGSLLAETGEIEHCDIELILFGDPVQVVQQILSTLELLGAPKGSMLRVGDAGETIPCGNMEGLAVYLNGTDLAREIYESSDSNFVFEEFARLLGQDGRVLSYWEGPTETAFYIYGPSFNTMKSKISEFLATYPLCQQCRVLQIA